MRILLLSPALTDEPLGLMYLSAVLKRAGFEVDGILFNHEPWNEEKVCEHVARTQPDVVLFSIITGEHVQCLKMNRAIRKHGDFKTVFGGPYTTYAPEMIEKYDGIDAVGLSECEEAIVDYCQTLAAGGDLTGIRNFWVRHEGGIAKNDVRPLADPNTHPFPDREIFKAYKKDGTFNLITERGCPYKCTYCFNHSFLEMYKGRSDENRNSSAIRFRSVPNILEEMRLLKANYAVEQFNFHDDIFPMRKSRTLEFCEAYAASGIGVPWSCSVKAEIMDEETVEAMHRAGCNKVFMGVEAGNDEVRRNLLLRKVTKKQMLDAANMFHARGIQVFTQSMMGLPGTDIEADFETMEFNSEIRPAFGWVSIFTPYPKTRLADYTFERKLVAENFLETMPNTYHYKTVLNVPHATQINALHKLYSLGVERPDLIPAIKEFVLSASDEDIDTLHNHVFLPFRVWKYRKLLDPDLPMPPTVQAFVDKLLSGKEEALAAVATSTAEAAGDARAWVQRDGVDATITKDRDDIIRSLDRHGAEP